jgi:hypothetical protein
MASYKRPVPHHIRFKILFVNIWRLLIIKRFFDPRIEIPIRLIMGDLCDVVPAFDWTTLEFPTRVLEIHEDGGCCVSIRHCTEFRSL